MCGSPSFHIKDLANNSDFVICHNHFLNDFDEVLSVFGEFLAQVAAPRGRIVDDRLYAGLLSSFKLHVVACVLFAERSGLCNGQSDDIRSSGEPFT